METLPKLYSELSDWWPILSSPADYAEEAGFYREQLIKHGQREIRSVLELGSGGGNNASHLKRHFKLTLVDLSPGMLQVSRKLNPECTHVQGDMRSVRLDQQFDAVFVHDAVMYITTIQDLTAVVETAYFHCRPGGVALFAPDTVKETFKTSTNHGGHDDKNRAMRYLEWTWDPDPDDDTCVSYMVYLLRSNGETIECVLDKHLCGLFHRDDWLQILERVGFIPNALPFDHSEIEPESTEVFIGIKPS
jgi:SAM-dependent methyltransferase